MGGWVLDVGTQVNSPKKTLAFSCLENRGLAATVPDDKFTYPPIFRIVSQPPLCLELSRAGTPAS